MSFLPWFAGRCEPGLDDAVDHQEGVALREVGLDIFDEHYFFFSLSARFGACDLSAPFGACDSSDARRFANSSSWRKRTIFLRQLAVSLSPVPEE